MPIVPLWNRLKRAAVLRALSQRPSLDIDAMS